MARIGLIEIKSRNHELSGLCKISHTARNKVTVFTTRKIFPHVEEELWGKTDGYEWVLDEENESTYQYLKRIEKICTDRIDLVIIKSLRDWKFVFFQPKCKVLAFIDDLNFWFKDTKSLSIYIKKIMDSGNRSDRRLLVNAITGPIIRRILLSRLNGVIVEYPPFKRYAVENLNYQGKLYFIPNRPFEGISPPANGTKVRFVIPGRIQEVRRDYQLLMRVFARLFAKHKDSIGMDLVGEPVGDYGQGIISNCEGFLSKGYDVFYPKQYVPPRTVEEKLTNADVIVSPLQVKYRSSTVEEIYTVTKPSGIFSDTIKYARPCFVPHTYNLTDEVKTSFLTYKDEDALERLLETLICDRKKLRELQEEALKNSEKFSLEKLQQDFDSMVEELL